ncbi:MAG TPA: dihydrofolate reductase family protein [Bacteriovoracaceae bacterium]|nr:dihydrofolate reductase family protein [Bacteriovoracaceae bacterium]
MRKVIAVEFVSLDGVIQAPGGPEEDTSEIFKFGGWLVPYSDEKAAEALGVTYGQPYDLLLGRRTYDIFAGYWPKVAAKSEADGLDESDLKFAREFDECTKYVATHSPDTLKWQHSQALGSDIVQGVKKLKSESGKILLVVGSSDFLHTLLANDLVDELHLHITPLILGKGKRLFDDNSKPRSLKLTRSAISSTGVLLMNYGRDGEVKTGSFA